jgi:hypothetical protein
MGADGTIHMNEYECRGKEVEEEKRKRKIKSKTTESKICWLG